MSDNDSKELRKEPKQRRSQQLFDAVLGAAARIFGSGKPENLSTNRVAEVAGVSIGSIYQYFPGKTAIATALGKRVVRQTFETLAEVIDRSRDEPLAVIVKRLVDSFIGLKLANLTMEQTLTREAFRIGFSEDLLALDPEMVALFTDRIRSLNGKVREDIDPNAAAYILYHSIRYTIIITSVKNPEVLRDPVFRREMIHLLFSALRGIEWVTFPCFRESRAS
jgi:AcrR family transcriptional regulator